MERRNLVLTGCWSLLIPLVELLYGPLNHSNGHVYSLVTLVDQGIPFNRFFIVPYGAWYGLIFVILFWFLHKDLKLYFSSLLSIIGGLLICFGVFSIFQTTVPRPLVPGSDLCSELTRLLYRIDGPYNAFPSIHVMTSFIIYQGCSRARTNARILSSVFQGVAVLVIVSTLFLKQHTLADVAGGVLLGGMLFGGIEAILKAIDTASFLRYYQDFIMLWFI